ncbi:Ig-like domain-containing domain [Cardinium endosymbiont of Encarsia pergandiella]|uniref:Ig-like domain-containing domain n=1 Tax=Cardinium endosymbiont of Encarsia pergandiella TaxID=249402 RepID=UPI0004BA5878|nr:Ig-like domain-containing domain [Cardinium endosymbiont of Encarsia pergandiella]
MMHRLISVAVQLLHLSYLWLIPIISCVAQQTPEGGPPDETPPKLIRSFPENGSLNFKGKQIRLTFDKDIAVEIRNFQIMPKLDQPKNKKAYSYTINGKTLELTLHVPLKEETTYAIHFNKAIKDRHEGTKATGDPIIFSTGAFIDPITITGKTKELLTNKPIGEVSVYLYNAARDPKEWQEKGIPDYYTTADKDGNFTIKCIRLGKYYIRATTGQNNTYKIDYEKDKYGFFKETIDLNDNREEVVIPLIASDVRPLKLLRGTPQKGFFEIVFNKAVTHYELTPLETIGAKGKPQLYSLLSEKSPKIINIYNTFGLLEGDAFKVKVKAEDALHRSLEESIAIKFKEGKAEVTKFGLSHRLSNSVRPSICADFTESILFNKPIKTFKEAGIYFEGKNQEKISLQANEWVWNDNQTKLTIRKHFTPEEICQFATKENKNASKLIDQIVTLQIEPGACTAFDQSTNKKIIQTYTLRRKEATGTISGKVETTTPYFIIELLDEKDQCVDAIRNTKKYQFRMVPPGTYKMRLLVLNEAEAEWSPGDILQNIEPNPVIFYEKEINVTEKWEVADIDFTF